MSIDRVATNAQTQYLLSRIMQANKALDTSQAQVSSGKVATDYAGIGDKTAALEAARAAAARADAYQSNTQLVVYPQNMGVIHPLPRGQLLKAGCRLVEFAPQFEGNHGSRRSLSFCHVEGSPEDGF